MKKKNKKYRHFYFLSTIRVKNKGGGVFSVANKDFIYYDSRTVGFFAEKKDAQYCLEHDVGGLNEAGYYPWAVIEKIPEGLYPLSCHEDEVDGQGTDIIKFCQFVSIG